MSGVKCSIMWRFRQTNEVTRSSFFQIFRTELARLSGGSGRRGTVCVGSTEEEKKNVADESITSYTVLYRATIFHPIWYLLKPVHRLQTSTSEPTPLQDCYWQPFRAHCASLFEIKQKRTSTYLSNSNNFRQSIFDSDHFHPWRYKIYTQTFSERRS